MNAPALIALDWGTSNLRASLLDPDAREIDRRSAPGGIMTVKDGRFSEALLSLVGDWVEKHPCPLMIFLGFGWGVTHESRYPAQDQKGANYTLPLAMEPLARHKADFSVVQGLWNKYNGNGHYGSTFWLTGANEFGVPGQSFHNTVSVDQVAADHLGKDNRFQSLVLDCGAAAQSSGHGQGRPLSWWDSPMHPAPALIRRGTGGPCPLLFSAGLTHLKFSFGGGAQVLRVLGKAEGIVPWRNRESGR